MKKSEMTIIIRKAIIDHNKSIGDFEGYGLGAAELILDMILEAGILPPEADDFNIGNCWESEEEVELPYGKSVVEEVNIDIKRLNDIAISSAHTLTLEKLLTAKEKLSNIE